MEPSTEPSTASSSDNVVRFIARSLAGEWPYKPELVEQRTHPSMRQHFKPVSRFLVMPNHGEREIQIAIETVRRHARLLLKDKDVRHFEVIPMSLPDYSTEPHIECSEDGCEDCNGLGHMFVPDKGAKTHLMGWLAITYVP